MNRLLEGRLGAVPADRRLQYGRILSQAIPPGLDPDRQEQLWKALPNSLDYHIHIVEGYRTMGLDVPVPEELLREGYDLQINCLAARMNRWTSRSPSSGDREAVESQIDTLVRATGTALKEKIQGEAGVGWIDQEMSSWRDGLRISLDMPLQEFLDRPLSPAQLDDVLAAIRQKLEFRPAIVLTPGDLADKKSLGGKGIRGMLIDAESAAYTACAACFREFQDLDRRTSEWKGKLKAEVEKALASRSRPAKKPDGSALHEQPSASIPPQPAADVKMPALPPTTAESVGTLRSPAGPAPAGPRALVVSLGTLAAILVAWTLWRRGRGQPPGNPARG